MATGNELSTSSNVRALWQNLWGGGTLRALRKAMGLGDTLGALPPENGGTGMTNPQTVTSLDEMGGFVSTEINFDGSGTKNDTKTVYTAKKSGLFLVCASSSDKFTIRDTHGHSSFERRDSASCVVQLSEGEAFKAVSNSFGMPSSACVYSIEPFLSGISVTVIPIYKL